MAPPATRPGGRRICRRRSRIRASSVGSGRLPLPRHLQPLKLSSRTSAAATNAGAPRLPRPALFLDPPHRSIFSSRRPQIHGRAAPSHAPPPPPSSITHHRPRRYIASQRRRPRTRTLPDGGGGDPSRNGSPVETQGRIWSPARIPHQLSCSRSASKPPSASPLRDLLINLLRGTMPVSLGCLTHPRFLGTHLILLQSRVLQQTRLQPLHNRQCTACHVAIQGSGSQVMEIIETSRCKAKTMVDVAFQAMCKVSEGQNTLQSLIVTGWSKTSFVATQDIFIILKKYSLRSKLDDPEEKLS